MHILIVQRFDLTTVSCTRRVVSQAQELAARGHLVTLVDFPHTQRRADLPSLRHLGLRGVRILRLSRRAVDLLSNCRKLARLDPRPDVVHLWKSYPDAAIPALVAADRADAPLHYDWDDWEPAIARELTGSRLAEHLASRWDRAILRVCDTCTVASKELKNTALDWDMPRERVWEAPVGADLTLFKPSPPDPAILQKIGGAEPPVMVYLGQLEVAVYAEKAVDVLALIVRNDQAARLLIIGGGRYEEKLKLHVERLGLEDLVHFTGYVPAQDVRRWLTVASVALAPLADTHVAKCKSPLKIAEYMAMGLPVVASDVGDATRMIDGAGFTVPHDDIEAMADRARALLADNELRKELSCAARSRAEEHYNWRWHVDQLEAAYRAALDA